MWCVGSFLVDLVISWSIRQSLIKMLFSCFILHNLQLYDLVPTGLQIIVEHILWCGFKAIFSSMWLSINIRWVEWSSVPDCHSILTFENDVYDSMPWCPQIWSDYTYQRIIQDISIIFVLGYGALVTDIPRSYICVVYCELIGCVS